MLLLLFIFVAVSTPMPSPAVKTDNVFTKELISSVPLNVFVLFFLHCLLLFNSEPAAVTTPIIKSEVVVSVPSADPEPPVLYCICRRPDDGRLTGHAAHFLLILTARWSSVIRVRNGITMPVSAFPRFVLSFSHFLLTHNRSP